MLIRCCSPPVGVTWCTNQDGKRIRSPVNGSTTCLCLNIVKSLCGFFQELKHYVASLPMSGMLLTNAHTYYHAHIVPAIIATLETVSLEAYRPPKGGSGPRGSLKTMLPD